MPWAVQKRRTPAAVTSTCQRPTQKKRALEFPKAKVAEIWFWPFTVSLKNFVRLNLLYREFWWKNQVHRCVWTVSSSAAMEKSLRYAEDTRFCDQWAGQRGQELWASHLSHCLPLCPWECHLNFCASEPTCLKWRSWNLSTHYVSLYYVL